MDNIIVSGATKKNWERLNVGEEEISERLSKRANKLYSNKRFIPKEYFNNKNNISVIDDFINYVFSKNMDILTVIFNCALNLLMSENLISVDKNNIKTNNIFLDKILKSYNNIELVKEIIDYHLPKDEVDILGIIYQSMMSEGDKNKKGSYYTTHNIIDDCIKNIKPNSVFLDPCCGTGSFLISAAEKIKNPDNIYGIDFDSVSCFISKINLIIKYKDKVFNPNIYNLDFLSEEIIDKFKTKKINYIGTNPPWGAQFKDAKNIKLNKKYNEIFSYFICQSKQILCDKGECYFVLPISIMNVAAHRDIRKFILDNFQIEEINLWGQVFKGVMSDVISLKLSSEISEKNIKITNKKWVKTVSKQAFLKNKNYNFMVIDNKDFEILDKIYSCKHTNLKNSLWGLGIVTGNNSKHIKTKLENGLEPVFTGKEIGLYNINKSGKFIDYNRENFQQTAPDYVYRAEEKLVYKFISKKLVFAYDNKKRLFLNSANILIPNVETHSVKTVLAFLNSELFSYIYKMKFGELKVLRGNLEELPFPYIDEKLRKVIETLVDNYISTQDKRNLDRLNEIIFSLFPLVNSDIEYIKSVCG